MFRDALGPDVAVYSQPDLVAEALADYLQRHPDKLGQGAVWKYLTTGDPKSVSNKATQFLRRRIEFETARGDIDQGGPRALRAIAWGMVGCGAAFWRAPLDRGAPRGHLCTDRRAGRAGAHAPVTV